MAYRCFVCNKGNFISKRGRHHKGVAGGQWKHKAQKTRKVFKANLHKTKVLFDGAPKRIKLCTDCISKMKKTDKLKHYKHTIERIVYTPVSPTTSK